MTGRLRLSMLWAMAACLIVLPVSGQAYGSVPTTAAPSAEAAQVRCSPGVPPGDCPAAANVYNFALSHNFSPPPGLRGGSAYQNANGLLPAGGDYLEYRIYSAPGSSQRLVIDRADPGGNSHYTPDHYTSFVQFYLPL